MFCHPCLVIFYVAFGGPRTCGWWGTPQKGSLWSWQSLLLSTVTSCLLELSKSQNDMTSEKYLLAMDPRQCMGHTERRSQSDTAVNITSRKASTPNILKAFHQEDPKHPPSPVLKQDTPPSSPTHSTVFSGGLRHVSLVPILLI